MRADRRDSHSLVARCRTIPGALPRAGILRAVDAATWPFFQAEGIAKKRSMRQVLIISSWQISSAIVEIFRLNSNRDASVRLI
jgi:hypothetical protein